MLTAVARLSLPRDRNPWFQAKLSPELGQWCNTQPALVFQAGFRYHRRLIFDELGYLDQTHHPHHAASRLRRHLAADFMLQIHNSLTKRKQPFSPIDENHVRMYVCGMTVYDYCHLGHARMMVVFDMVVRYLRARGYRVTYVRNITDIDDKIIKRAKENAESFEAVTERFIGAMHEDFEALGVLRPDIEPRATEYVPQMQAMITALLEKGFAYRGSNGDVYYDVSRFEKYGALSGQQLGKLRAGARVEIDEAKDDPLDFVLWKAAKPGEPSWDSPWGPGRPGWHIECSAMSSQNLGEPFDIHGGGMDLKFPHHDSEIAQSEAATGKEFVRLWMHNGFVRIDDEKMSKSLGNFFTIREILARYDPEVVRYFLLASHYRSPVNFSDKSLDQARRSLTTLYTSLRGLEIPDYVAEQISRFLQSTFAARFFRAMDDDFNTVEALAALFDLANYLNRLREEGHQQAIRHGAILRHLGEIIGLLQRDPEEFFQRKIEITVADKVPITEHIEALIEQRAVARQRKDWAEADRVRDELKARGVILEDDPDGTTTWRRE
jgi:cysteinyl-tRNA synthetase